MKQSRLQSGLSIPSFLIIATMVGFFIMAAIKLAPRYFEYLSVKEIVTKVAREFELESDTAADARLKLATLINTNQIYDLDYKDIEIFREDGRLWIDASYEARVPLLWRIDAVMKFDDLKYEAGVAGPP